MAGSENRRLPGYEVGARPAKKSSTASKNGSKPSSAPSSARGTKPKNSTSKEGMKKQASSRKNTIEENPIAHRTSHAYREAAPVRSAPRRPETYDAYDAYDYPVPPRRSPQGTRKRRKKKKKSAFGFMSFVLLMMILGCAGLGVWRVQEYQQLQVMKAAVSRQTFYEGTTVDGVDVSQMTLEQSLDYWNEQVEPAYRRRAAVLNDGTRVTAEQLGYSSNYADVLSGAWNTGRYGSLVERYQRMTAYSAQPQSFTVTRSMYDEGLVNQYAQGVAAQVDTAPVNASLKSFNVETYAFEFEPDRPGYTLNQAALSRDICAALSAGGGNVEMQIETVQPQFTQENVSSQYGMISYAVTNASSSSSNRLSNIRLALSSINGVWLDPGESFSFNQVVGQRTTARGYKTAAAYASGKVIDEVGGGICQVSTTLFNAAVKADMKITQRSAHSMTVSYVDIGKDAAVDWGNKDLCFTNNSDDRVYICGYVTDDKRVRIGIFGRLLENGVSITVEGKKTGTNKYKTEQQMNFNMASGKTKVVQQGKNGYTATTYKVWWDSNGNEIKREELCKSNYQSTPEIIEYGVM